MVRSLARSARAAAIRSINPLLFPRRFHAYSLGTLRSGTGSVAGLFGRYRAAHERDATRLVEFLLASVSRPSTEHERTEFIRQRDRQLWLELDSSYLNQFFVDVLVREFPAATFILTIRDCYSWLDSMINQHMRAIANGWEITLRDLMFRPTLHEFSPEERILHERGLYPLDAYFSYWSRHNRRVIAEVPSERLLVVRTDRLPLSLDMMAHRLKISRDTLDESKVHVNKMTKKWDVVAGLDQAFVRSRAQALCGDLVATYFPELPSGASVSGLG